LVLFASLGFVLSRQPPTAPESIPDLAPVDNAPLGSNTLLLNNDRVAVLGLAIYQTSEVDDVVFIPHDAVQTAPNGSYLWLEDYELAHVFHKVRVTVGSRQGERIEIKTGVLSGDKVVVRNANKLRFECDIIKRPPVQTNCS
jgi:multidrug efflux pump subunit AcrA (membrane-fusion protein)